MGRKTIENKEEKLAKAKELIANGYKIPEAARVVGFSKNTLYSILQKEKNQETPRVNVRTVEPKVTKKERKTATQQVYMFVGSPSALLELSRKMKYE